VRSRHISACGGQRLAAESLQIAHVAELYLPVPIDRELGRKQRGVVESGEQLLDDERQLLRWVEPPS
jgi:hypothetical protein